jgi:uncharacterized protein with beta-barrel porin domain
VHVGTKRFAENGDDAALSGDHSTLGVRAATMSNIARYAATLHASAAWQYACGDITPEIICVCFDQPGVL